MTLLKPALLIPALLSGPFLSSPVSVSGLCLGANKSRSGAKSVEEAKGDWDRIRGITGADPVLLKFGTLSDEMRDRVGEVLAEQLVEYRSGEWARSWIGLESTQEKKVGDSHLRVTLKVEVDPPNSTS